MMIHFAEMRPISESSPSTAHSLPPSKVSEAALGADYIDREGQPSSSGQYGASTTEIAFDPMRLRGGGDASEKEFCDFLHWVSSEFHKEPATASTSHIEEAHDSHLIPLTVTFDHVKNQAVIQNERGTRIDVTFSQGTVCNYLRDGHEYYIADINTETNLGRITIQKAVTALTTNLQPLGWTLYRSKKPLKQGYAYKLVEYPNTSASTS